LKISQADKAELAKAIKNKDLQHTELLQTME